MNVSLNWLSSYIDLEGLGTQEMAGIYHADVEVVTALYGSLLHDLGYHYQICGNTALLNALYLNAGKGEHVGHFLCAESLQVNIA